MIKKKKTITAISSRSFSFRPMRPKIDRILATRGTFWSAHPALVDFCLGVYGGSLKRGKLLDMRRMCRTKKPEFWVEKDGYPLTL